MEVVIALVHPENITVLGSSAFLAHDPDLGEEGKPLELSLDADLLVVPCDDRQAAVLHEAVGEGSLFHREYGVYADFMRSDIVSTLPKGWERRCLPLAGYPSVRCVDPYDLAIVKLVLGRDKDMDLLKVLVKRGTLNLATLRDQYQDTPLDEQAMFQAGRNLQRLEP
jgi:hypothetical protein